MQRKEMTNKRSKVPGNITLDDCKHKNAKAKAQTDEGVSLVCSGVQWENHKLSQKNST